MRAILEQLRGSCQLKTSGKLLFAISIIVNESRAVLLEIEDRVSPRERLLKLDQSEPSAERRTTGVSQRSKRTQILEHELILAVQTIKH